LNVGDANHSNQRYKDLLAKTNKKSPQMACIKGYIFPQLENIIGKKQPVAHDISLSYEELKKLVIENDENIEEELRELRKNPTPNISITPKNTAPSSKTTICIDTMDIEEVMSTSSTFVGNYEINDDSDDQVKVVAEAIPEESIEKHTDPKISQLMMILK
jgi:hypothetical protein